MEEQERIVKGIWIPIDILKDKNLSWNEKLLYLEIDSFTSNDKDCFISDEYIANFLGINTTNANKTLSSLIKKGYVVKTRFDGRHRFVKAALSTSTTLNCQEQQPFHAHDSNILNNNNNNITNTITINEKEKKSKGFVKPTIQEIQAHILEKGYTFDAEAFYAFYESNGWKVGKNPMKNWKMACTTWAKNRKNNNNNVNYGRETITDKIRRTVEEANIFSQKLADRIGEQADVCDGDNDEVW